MDKMIYFTGHYQRQINFLPPVSDIGYLYNKTDTVYQTFNSCNFSFVLRGNGWYIHNGQKIKVIAPAILLQWPGHPNNYGPDTSWDEYFLMFKAEHLDKLILSGLFNIEKPVLPIKKLSKNY